MDTADAAIRERILFYSAPWEECPAFEAGKKILEGDCSYKNLRAIVMWKSPRTAGKKLETDNMKIKRALQNAVASKDDPRQAIEALWLLKGVGIPVASAIMTAIDPENYTIIDKRVRESLKLLSLGREFAAEHGKDTVGEYVDYLDFCKSLARDLDVSLRNLDDALWQYSYEHGIDWIPNAANESA